MLEGLDPQIVRFLEERKAKGVPPMYTVSPEQARKGAVRSKDLGGPLKPVADIQNIDIPGSETRIPIRIYTPQGKGPFPILVQFHGGGWVVGSPDSHESSCRTIANRAACIVISVDYRLSPEHKFPAALHDAYDAVIWASRNGAGINGDPERLAIGGESAGGNLATVVCLMAKERRKPDLIFQLLVYPVTDLSSFETKSYNQYDDGLVLSKKSMVYCAQQYLRKKEDGFDPMASPLLAKDVSGLPPAHFVLAEFDVLNNEALAYAKKLEQAGVPVTLKTYAGMIHPFLNYGGITETSIEAQYDIGKILKAVFTETT